MSYPSAPEWAMNIRCLTTGGVLPVRVSKAPPPVLLARDQERSICVGPIRPQDLIKDNFALRLIRASPLFRSFSAAAGECGLLSQASRMVADLGADSVSYCFPSQPRRKSLCNCINSLADARAAVGPAN